MNDKTEQYWYLYLIETRYKTWYCGITRDWKRRFEEHQSNGNKTAKFLKGKGPLKLIFCIQLDNHSQALKAEIWLKKQSKAKKRAITVNTSGLPFDHVLVEHTKNLT